MSINKWAYDPEKCDDHICPGDCDFCSIWKDAEAEDEAEAEDIKRGRKNDG